MDAPMPSLLFGSRQKREQALVFQGHLARDLPVKINTGYEAIWRVNLQ